jgi:hypothetical protein
MPTPFLRQCFVPAAARDLQQSRVGCFQPHFGTLSQRHFSKISDSAERTEGRANPKATSTTLYDAVVDGIICSFKGPTAFG